MTGRLTCDDVRDRELIERYAVGTLGEAEAETLEAHAIECEACWAEMQAAVEIRAAMLASSAHTPIQNGRPHGGRTLRWQVAVPLAVAALALFGIGLAVVIQHRQSIEQAPIRRGAGVDEIRVKASRQADGSLRFDWTALPSVSDYVVTVKLDGATVLTGETAEPQFVVPRGRFTAGSRLIIEVAGQSPDGGTIANGSLALTVR